MHCNSQQNGCQTESAARLAIGRGRLFLRDKAGTIAPIFALGAMVMTLSVGGAIDIGRWLQARSQTKAAIDSAVLAAARTLQTNSADQSSALTAANSYYETNTQNRIPVLDDTIAFQVAADGKSVSATGSAFVATPFLALARISKLPLLDQSGAEYASATTEAVGRQSRKLEISLMLDVTGSMQGDKLAELKAAAKDLVDILVRDDSTDTRMALAPFSDAVRPGSYLAQVRGSAPSSKSVRDRHGRWQTYRLTNCVGERDGSAAYTDDAPAGSDAMSPVYTRDGSCNPGADIVPLTSDRSRLASTIDGLSTDGYTAGHLGTAWAWYLLSPKWSSVWTGSHAPAAYGNPDVKKVAVLLTDGEYNMQYDASGVSTRDSGARPMNAWSDDQAREICRNMKAAGIEVYTIGFDLRNANAIETLSQCATSARNRYLAENGDELKQAFRDIALTLTPIHLTR